MHRDGQPGKLKLNLKDSTLDVFQHGLGRSGKSAQQVAALGNHRLAANQWPFQALDELVKRKVLTSAQLTKIRDLVTV